MEEREVEKSSRWEDKQIGLEGVHQTGQHHTGLRKDGKCGSNSK